ncbi:DUF4191 domain-containing protein [Homoserinimonas sp. OAct 916]|uniref:DUF4191 domain-containing protein n=1 Tax=Homoserinimonas sp. OAct 916 TaxID=2211450 RepID=UPI000DBE1C4E|nr:DUF4191 domain-containing protein [Homoserinimonas sp. OAct 916]
MARSKDEKSSKKKKKKSDGRFKQMWQVFKMTRRYDPNAQWFMALGFILPVLAALVFVLVFPPGNGFAIGMWIVAGVMGGLLIALIILGRRAERAAYSQIEGQPGAVGAILRSPLRKGWRGSEMPVSVNPKTQDAIYRAVGRGGVVLISEGPKGRMNRMVEDERRKVQRVLPNVPVTTMNVGPDDNAVPLHKIVGKLAKIKPVLTKAEVLAVSNRLTSLSDKGLPIPKGVDPFKVKAQRPR